MYPELFKQPYELKGDNYALRYPKEDHLEALFEMLQDENTINYVTEKRYNSIEQVKQDYLVQSYYNFQNKISLCYVIEDIQSGKAVGFRELFVDKDKQYITVQGFIHPNHRRKGISKESYLTIINFLKYFNVSELLANSRFDNYASMSLLDSLGFTQSYLADTSKGLMGVYRLDLQGDTNTIPKYNDALLKRIRVFCTMYLCARTLKIEQSTPIKYDGVLSKGYKVTLSAPNWAFPNHKIGLIKNISFYTNGVIIMNTGNSPSIAIIDGRSPLVDAWGYCWDVCVI